MRTMPGSGSAPSCLLETPGHSWASLGQSLVGSLLLSPGSWCAHSSVCALQNSVSPVLCKFWWLYGGVNGGLLQEGLCIPRSAAPRVPAPATGHCGPTPPLETPGHSRASLGQSLVGSLLLSPGSWSGPSFAAYSSYSASTIEHPQNSDLEPLLCTLVW